MEIQTSTLTNGLPLLLGPMPETPRMALAVTIDGGVREEPVAGVGKLASRLLLKGTARRTAEQIARELDERAIDLHEMSRADCTVLLAVFLNTALPAVLDVLRDVLLHSTFRDYPRELEKLEGEVRSSQDMPAALANSLLVSTLFATHPYGNSGLRFLETMGQLSEELVRAWYGSELRASRMNVTVVGDFAVDEMRERLAETFGDLPSGGAPASTAPPTPVEADRLVTAARPDAQQAQVYQGWYAPRLGAAAQAAMTVMNTIFGGGGLSNRLFVNLRDRQGLAYSVSSQYIPMRDAGEVIVSIGTSPENIARARQGFAEQIAIMRETPITPDELHFAKGRLRGAYVLSHETTSQHCLDIAVNHINGLGPDYSARLLERLEGVTVAEVRDAACLLQPPTVTAIVARDDAVAGVA